MDTTGAQHTMTTEIWSPISIGTWVRTTQPNKALRKEWIQEAWEGRQWGVKGKVLAHHDSHGLSYQVQHPDGTVGHYDPSELQEATV